MKTRTWNTLRCSLFAALVIATAGAQTPRTLSYQGVLTDTLGNPRPDGTYAFAFRLYESGSGGDPVWTEQKSLVLRRGLFHTILGDITPFAQQLQFDRPYWLGVQVATEPELSPRIPLTAVGYSLNALHADTARYAMSLPSQAVVDSARIAGTVPNNSITTTKILDGTIQRTDVAGTFKAPYADTADAARSSAPSGVAGGDLTGTYPNPELAHNPASLAKVSGGIITALGGNVGIGTTTPSTKLHIKGTADATQLTIDANTSQSNGSPLIRLRDNTGVELLRIHSDRPGNTFIGVEAGGANDAGGGGEYNTFVGFVAGYANTTGTANTALGRDALYNNSVGSYNTACGMQSLLTNVSGSSNTATGVGALAANTTGSYNTAGGRLALSGNKGNFNTGYGTFALFATGTSDYNTAVGHNAGANFHNGYNNVFVGANADVNANDLYNVIAIGQATIVTSSSTARFGNPATTSYGGWAGWSNVSDGRFKKNVRENVPGLEFITRLRPITYNLDATAMDAFLRRNEPAPASDARQGLSAGEAAQPARQGLSTQARAVHEQALRAKEQVLYTGFAAQEVEAAARELGFDFSGVDAPKNANDYYGLRYADFVVPLVKAVQEQQKMIEELKREIAALKGENR